MSEDDAFALVEQLEEIIEDSPLREELETVKSSLEFYFTGSQIGIDVTDAVLTSEGCRVREERIAQNIMQVLQELDGAPVLVKCGGWHAQKRQATFTYSDVQPWAHQLSESGVSIYSVYAAGMSGHVWHPSLGEISYEKDIDRMQFADGTRLGSILESVPDYSIIYVDLRLQANASAHLGYSFDDTPAGMIYDGIIVFRKVTPLVQKGM